MSLPTKLLKNFRKSLSKPPIDLINLSFSNGEFPSILKITKIIPTHKKGDTTECNNYRPISLTSNVSKLIEKIIHQRLYSFLERNNVFYESQFGFRNNHSTNHALLKITENIREACDKNEFTCGVFLDLKKTFDTVNHEILLSKLEHYGVRGVANKWFRSFICNRIHYTTILNKDSGILVNTHGFRQASVLGPLLFILYINDLNICVEHSKVHHFADDTNLLYVNKSLKKSNSKINHDLSRIVHWLRANKISLNTSKTEIVSFRPRQKVIKKK